MILTSSPRLQRRGLVVFRSVIGRHHLCNCLRDFRLGWNASPMSSGPRTLLRCRCSVSICSAASVPSFGHGRELVCIKALNILHATGPGFQALYLLPVRWCLPCGERLLHITKFAMCNALQDGVFSISSNFESELRGEGGHLLLVAVMWCSTAPKP